MFNSIMVGGFIDPSVMTYAIQAIAGVVIAVGAAVGIYWRKAKKKVNEKLGIDENRNKEVSQADGNRRLARPYRYRPDHRRV